VLSVLFLSRGPPVITHLNEVPGAIVKNGVPATSKAESGLGMLDKIRECMAEAEAARQNAQKANGDIREKWLEVADAWEQLAAEYQSLAAPGANGA
jgi:hypothetical protein